LNEPTLAAIIAELEPIIKGRRLGKIFQLSPLELVIDLGLGDGLYLFLCLSPNPAPRLYLIRRSAKTVEKHSGNPAPVTLQIKKHLTGARITSLTKDPGERIARFVFSAENDLGETETFTLLAQLTGRSANLFLLDKDGRVIAMLRKSKEASIGSLYSSPKSDKPAQSVPQMAAAPGQTLSETVDRHYTELQKTRRAEEKVKSARARIQHEITRRQKLLANLKKDLAAHGAAEKYKLYGDLLLANLAAAKRAGGLVTVTNFFDPEQKEIVIEVDKNIELPRAAEKFFDRYAKAKRAAAEIARRYTNVEVELTTCAAELAAFDKAVAEGRAETVVTAKDDLKSGAKAGKQTASKVNFARVFTSSDDRQIYVGKASKDNDWLTFRFAKSWDWWLHAADYPGSHVVVSNPGKSTDIPHRTLIEAAQLAAYFSQAKKQPKAAVNYTQRKFVAKIKGGPPGLVRLSQFKTVMVEPQIAVKKTEE
jgi:predicted ribosome quality control (RQC) complex YloA/Tae2 family protein